MEHEILIDLIEQPNRIVLHSFCISFLYLYYLLQLFASYIVDTTNSAIVYEVIDWLKNMKSDKEQWSCFRNIFTLQIFINNFLTKF